METYCIFSAQYLPTFGGVEQYTENLANKLLEKGNKVIIVTSMKEGTADKEILDNGLIIYRLPTIQLINGRMPFTYYSRKWNRLKTLLKEYNITRVIIQTRLYTLSIMGMRFAKKNNIPCMTIEHGTSYVGMSNKLVQFFEIIYEKIMIKLAKKYCHTFCAVSKEGSIWLSKIGLPCSAVLYNSVDYKRIREYLSNSFCEDISYSEQEGKELTVVYVGRLIKEKGVNQLVQAVEELCHSGKKIKLIIVGDGPLFNELKKGNFKSVILTGRLSQKEVMEVLRRSDVFCLPSDSEGFPTSVLESILCKTYVITAPYGGAKEIIVSKEYGLVMQDNTCESIKKGILEAINLGEDRHRIEENVYKRFMDEFTWDNTCNTLEKLQWGARR